MKDYFSSGQQNSQYFVQPGTAPHIGASPAKASTAASVREVQESIGKIAATYGAPKAGVVIKRYALK